MNFTCALVDRNDGRLEEHDPLAASVDDRVRRAEIDGKLRPS
jgi:hypothetical protein